MGAPTSLLAHGEGIVLWTASYWAVTLLPPETTVLVSVSPLPSDQPRKRYGVVPTVCCSAIPVRTWRTPTTSEAEYGPVCHSPSIQKPVPATLVLADQVARFGWRSCVTTVVIPSESVTVRVIR